MIGAGEAGSYDSNEVRAEVVIDGRDSKDYVAALELQKGALEQEVGEQLTWHSSEGVRMCRIFVRKPTALRDRDHWPADHEWLLRKREILHRVFAPQIKSLTI
jgi:hypothetical protein